MRRCHIARWWSAYALQAELYTLTLLGALLLPTGIDAASFHRAGFLAVGFLTERLTAVSAVFVCCLSGAALPQKWHLIGFAIVAALFFSFLYTDTAVVNRMEAQLDRKVQEIPAGSRVVANISTMPMRVTTQHIIDRACIGRCFSYANYEPSSALFRVRADPGNPFVMDDAQNARDALDGEYVVRASDLPLFEIMQRGSSATTLCVRELTAGERTSSAFKSLAFKRGSVWFQRFNATSLLVDLSPGLVLFVCMYAGRRLKIRLQRARAASLREKD